MPLNKLINPYYDTEQLNLVKDLMEEIIQCHGVEIYYLPRTSVNMLNLLGEDPLAYYDDAILIEAMPIEVDNWQGEGDIITQFGIDVKDRITFQIMKHRWEQEQRSGLYSSQGRAIIPSNSSNTHSGPILLNSNNPNKSYTLTNRPMEGDLIWFSMTKKLFVIVFVEHEKMFYPLGELLTYQLTCELYDYSSEELNTGVSTIDQIEDVFSVDIAPDAILTSDESTILTSSNTDILASVPQSVIDRKIKYANNELIQDEADNLMIFDELNPLLVDQRKY